MISLSKLEYIMEAVWLNIRKTKIRVKMDCRKVSLKEERKSKCLALEWDMSRDNYLKTMGYLKA